MTKTAELLAVYRRLVFLNDENARLRASRNVWKKKYEEAEKANADLADAYCEELRAVEDLASKYADERCDWLDAFDVIMELIGAITAEEAAYDALSKSIFEGFETGEFAHKSDNTMPASVSGVNPLRCLSCGDDKGTGVYFCGECFERNLDGDNALYIELTAAWQKGDRDFPRPGKNAKKLWP